MEKDFDKLSAEELADLAIFTPVQKRVEKLEGRPDGIPGKGRPEDPYQGKPGNPNGGKGNEPESVYYVIPNQKILTFHPEDLEKLIPKKDKAEDHQKPPRKDNSPLTDSLNISLDYLKSLIQFLEAKIDWEFRHSEEEKAGFKKEPKRPVHGKDITFIGRFESNREKDVLFRVIRISDCLNEEEEFRFEGPSVNILVEWDEVYATPPGDIELPFESVQADNLLLINHEVKSRPSYPPQATGEVIRAYDSDFKPFMSSGSLENNDSQFYSDLLIPPNSQRPIVAVMDTGLAYKWSRITCKRRTRGRYFIHFDRIKHRRDFLIAKAQNSDCVPVKNFGFCGVTDYLLKPVYIGQLRVLRQYTTAQIMASPYDDNLVDVKVEGDVVVKKAGRHGSIVSAIINYPYPNVPEPTNQVLPVKVFNYGGIGTLFDVLSGFNYIIASKKAGVDIKIINASFSGSLSNVGRYMLYQKLKTITETHKIWVIAAAGNQRWNLDEHPLYPASFGLPAVRGGLDKVITVTSAYNDGNIVGNRGDAVSIKARSAFPDGFLSVLLMEGGARLQGTSFAVPYAAAVLATAPNNVATRADAIDYLLRHPIPGVVSFEHP
ncbi:S8/S53 family peptidase [Telluribacter sp. SYSU D00476]|uniref:S8/S53 family peptidase n=1 Tax=Telluribacter sp. SYSU D00476 TaxID=2811430 RepID=UPI001FF5BEB9|nr:S8/S53 family peptidase [Telluribacter sp. SYSU D00476]